MLDNNFFCLGVGLIQYRFYFYINLLSGPFATIPLNGSLCSGQKSSILSLSTAHESNSFAHTEQANHLASQSSRMFQIVFCTGRHFVKHNLFRSTPSEHPTNPV